MWFKKIKTINRIYGEAKPPQNFSDDFGGLLSNGAHVTWSCLYLWARKIQSEGIWGGGWGWWWFGFFPVLLEYHKSWEKSLSLKQLFRKQICFNFSGESKLLPRLGPAAREEEDEQRDTLEFVLLHPSTIGSESRTENAQLFLLFFLYHKLAELPFFTCGRINNS